MKNTAYIGVGSNLGDRIGNCLTAIDCLAADGAVEISAVSPFYYTEPVGYADQPWFANAVLSCYTRFSPAELLKRLKHTECVCGRTASGIRFGPRVIDLDILLYGGMVLNTPELVIPHPRIHQRRFVLQPLCDIAADLVLPGMDMTMRQLIEMLPDDGQKCLPAKDCVDYGIDLLY